MKPFSPKSKTLFIFTSRSLFTTTTTTQFQISLFSTSAANPFHSSPNSSYPSRRHEEESRNVKVSVWWDFENCSLPCGANVFRVAHSITAAIRANGIKGPVQVTAFGDVFQLSRSNQEALSSTGVNLTHIPNGGKNSADRSLLVDLMFWVSQNPPPAHLFLISGDRDFAGILHRLRMNNYNILLASPDSAPGVLCSAASIMWHWNVLVKGENLTGKHFNQPPDGRYGSWYGHYRAPLEDPFAVSEQPVGSRVEEPSDFGLDAMVRPVPKAVMKQIRHILSSYPKGIPITELRSELAKSNVSVDKDLYGYRKFSRFLLSMPHILKLQSRNDGQFLVRSVTPKGPESIESTSDTSNGRATDNGDLDFIISPKSNGRENSSDMDEKPSSSSHEVNVKEPVRKMEQLPERLQDIPNKVTYQKKETSNKVPDTIESVENVNKAKEIDAELQVQEPSNPLSEVWFFRRIWTKWFGSEGGGTKETSNGRLEQCSNSSQRIEKTKNQEKYLNAACQRSDSVDLTSNSLPNVEKIIDMNAVGNSKADADRLNGAPGVFKKIVDWCKWWKTDQNARTSDNIVEQSNDILKNTVINSGKHEVFSNESFWNEVEAFLDTDRGSDLILQSRNREHMAQNLQKQGPQVLCSLGETDLLHLVELLVSEKKMVAEHPSKTFPFKLVRPPTKSTSRNSCSSNGLRPIFLGTSPEHELEKRHQNFPHAGVSLPISHTKPSGGKSRSDILTDCQKLVDEVTKKYPEGFNIGAFRKLFLERYGYALDLQKLGYNKLATLLQIMPGVRIEATYIFPSAKFSQGTGQETVDPNGQENYYSGSVANSERDSSDALMDNDFDSPWEELGPVAYSIPKREKMTTGLDKKLKEETAEQIHHEYESPSDDYLSDSEEENSSLLMGSADQRKSRVNEEDSSLLQILDSWYSSKKENNKKDNVDGMVDCSTNASLSPPSGVGIKSETLVGSNGRKQRPSKSYSFVLDESCSDDKDKLIDGILGSLKKSSSESRVQG